MFHFNLSALKVDIPAYCAIGLVKKKTSRAFFFRFPLFPLGTGKRENGRKTRIRENGKRLEPYGGKREKNGKKNGKGKRENGKKNGKWKTVKKRPERFFFN